MYTSSHIYDDCSKSREKSRIEKDITYFYCNKLGVVCDINYLMIEIK